MLDDLEHALYVDVKILVCDQVSQPSDVLPRYLRRLRASFA
jgi:hypothetical protein